MAVTADPVVAGIQIQVRADPVVAGIPAVVSMVAGILVVVAGILMDRLEVGVGGGGVGGAEGDDE